MFTVLTVDRVPADITETISVIFHFFAQLLGQTFQKRKLFW